MHLNPELIHFYLDGRGEDLLDDDDVDLDKLVEQALAGPDAPGLIARRVGEQLASPLEYGTERREWLEENKDGIAEAGGDGDAAWRHYLAGRVDQYVHALEDDIVTNMFEDDGDGDGDDDEDGDDDDDE